MWLQLVDKPPGGKNDIFPSLVLPVPIPGPGTRLAVRVSLRGKGGKSLAKNCSAEVGADSVFFLGWGPTTCRTEEDA